MKTLQELFDNISNLLNEGKELKELIPLVCEYCGDDWKEYINFSVDRYTKNLVYRNDKVDILVICWNKNQVSGIHDHPDNGCILKVMDGELIEQVYDNDNLIKVNKCCKNDISFQKGKKGLHNIINGNNETVSIHVYSPPNYKPNFSHPVL